MTCRWTNLGAVLGLALWLSMPNGAAAQQAARPDARPLGSPGVDPLEIRPAKLDLLVGEIADLGVVSPGTTPVRISSSKPARRRGHVAQPAHRPQRRRRRGRGRPRQPPSHRRGPRRQGRVPIDRHRSGQRGGDGRRCRLPPRRRPRQGRPTGARWNWPPTCWPATRRLRPAMPISTPSGWSCGGSCRPKRVPRRRWRCASPRWRPRQPVEVVVAPLRLELTPAGPVDLPLGQMARLQGWAHYSGGRGGRRPRPALDLANRQSAQAGARHRIAGR